MRRRVCEGHLEKRVTDLPFNVADTLIVIVKALPVLECGQCGETELKQATLTRVDALRNGVDRSAELEVIRFAA